MEVLSGTLAFPGGFAQTGGLTSLAGGGLASTSRMEILGGTVAGSGTIVADLNNAGGRVSPGASIGHLILDGDYSQGQDGILLIEIGGTAPGEYDVLEITGHATLGGALEVALIDGFKPSCGDVFEFMTFGSRTGEFTEVNGLNLGDGIYCELAYGPQSASITTVPEPATLCLLIGGLALGFAVRRREKAA